MHLLEIGNARARVFASRHFKSVIQFRGLVFGVFPEVVVVAGRARSVLRLDLPSENLIYDHLRNEQVEHFAGIAGRGFVALQ
jgi:hypothetical protein